MIIEHMNQHHKDVLCQLFAKYGNKDKIPQDAELIDFDENGLLIESCGEKVKVPFNGKVVDGDFKGAIMALAATLKQSNEQILQEIKDFKNEFRSVIIGSLSKDKNQAIASYAPLLRADENLYIYVSEISEHFESISSNPDALEILFLQDEKEAKSIILRKRLNYKTSVSEVKRDSDEFNKVIENFLKENENGAGGTKIVAGMKDFHLFKLNFKNGRYVKGFGGAYDIKEDGSICPPHLKNPHKTK